MTTIERKFDMLSTKEWMQYLQYKLSPEREKEMEFRTTTDPFLKETLEALSSQESRPVAFHSISYLISMIEENTGVSESKILRSSVTNRNSPASSFNPKMAGMVIGGLLLLGLLGYGVHYIATSEAFSFSSSDSAEVSDIDSLNQAISTYADSSQRPFDVLPGTQQSVDTTPTVVTNPMNSAAKPARKSTHSNATEPISVESSPSSPSNTSNASVEQEKFDQAQEYYKQGKRDEAKKLLNELKGYDNSKKAQAESILNSIGN